MKGAKMPHIQLTQIDDSHFEVSISNGTSTTHQVSVQLGYAQKLTAGKISTEELVKKSFEFLLERESNTSILRSFDLSVIAHYFPEYEREIMQA
jgi:hypothetical protein